LFTSAGIRISAVDNDSPSATKSKMVSIQNHRRGNNAILCEHPGDRSADVGYTEGQIEEVWFFYSTMNS
jgi:hypothetical protein